MPRRDIGARDLAEGAVSGSELGGPGVIGAGSLTEGAVGVGGLQAAPTTTKKKAATSGSVAKKKAASTTATRRAPPRAASASASSSITSTTGDPLRDAAEQYPSLAGLLGIAEIADKIRTAVAEGWSPEKMTAEIQATMWWRETPAEKRAWIALEAFDPASAARKVATTRDDVRTATRDYAIRLDQAAVDRWARSIASGDVTADEYRAYLVEQAKSAYPGLAGALDRGVTVAQYAAPYAAVAADELGITAADIDFSDPKWNVAINAVDPKTGDRHALTLADWQSEVRRNDAYGWDRSPNARKQAVQFATTLGRMFGGIG